MHDLAPTDINTIRILKSCVMLIQTTIQRKKKENISNIIIITIHELHKINFIAIFANNYIY